MGFVTMKSEPEIDSQAALWLARLDAGLSAAERDEYEAWRAADPLRAAAISRLGGAWSRLDQPLRMGTAATAAAELRRRHRRRQWRRAAAGLGMAAAVAAGLV